MALKSKYAIRLFELFKSYQYQKIKEFGIDELKSLLYAENYDNFAHFKKRVLEPAISEINEFTEIKVSYATISKGRKVIKVRFEITRKPAIETYISYQKTIEKIDEDSGQIKGQIHISDLLGV